MALADVQQISLSALTDAGELTYVTTGMPGNSFFFLINALAVCIVGGLGSTVGILVASVVIGFAQTFTANYLEPHWMILVSLIAIAVVLTIKPSGLFSRQKELEERI